jgi:septal ring factor EnvC (AmiA/AmiB activator)
MTTEAKGKLGQWVVLGSLVIALLGMARGLVADASGIGEYKAGFENICKTVEKITLKLEDNDKRDQGQDKDIAELKTSVRNTDANMGRVNDTLTDIQRDIKTLLARRP